MKVSAYFAAAALLVAPTTGFGAIIGVINGDGADAVVSGPSGAGQDGTGLAVLNPPGFTLKVGSVGGTNADRGRVPVFVFQLPDLGVIANPFTAASFSFGVQNIDGSANVPNTVTDRNADLYGLDRRDVAPAIAAADYYLGNSEDSTDAVRLQTNILTPSTTTTPGTTPNTIISTDATGSANLLAFLNLQYDGGAGIGEYVYLRLNVDGEVNGGSQGYNVHTANEPDEAKRPTINFTAIPEPSSVALLALGGLGGLALNRRRRSR